MESDKEMVKVASRIKWKITDSCPSKLFTADDILLQQVKNDFKGMEKEWVAVVNLNTQSKNGYLQSELPYCKVRKYLIGAKTVVKAYVDNDGCCDGLKEYKQCQSTCEDDKLTELKDNRDKHYSKDVILTGTHYKVTNSIIGGGRRRLLQESETPPT